MVEHYKPGAFAQPVRDRRKKHPSVGDGQRDLGLNQLCPGAIADVTDRLTHGAVGMLFSAVADRLSERTRLVVLDHVSSPTGLIFPVAELTALGRARGVRVLIDGAHGPGQLELDVPALGADWYVGSCHKWLFAPRSCAFLLCRDRSEREL